MSKETFGILMRLRELLSIVLILLFALFYSPNDWNSIPETITQIVQWAWVLLTLVSISSKLPDWGRGRDADIQTK